MDDVDIFYEELDRLKYVSQPSFSMLSEASLRGKAVLDAKRDAFLASLTKEELAERLREVSDPEFYTIVVHSPSGRRVVLGPGTGGDDDGWWRGE